MGLPAQLQEDFHAAFKREPLIVTCAICDLSGVDGLTWLATEGTTLVCYTQPAGGEFARLDFRIAEATEFEMVKGISHLLFHARFPEDEFVLRLLPDEAPMLMQLTVLQPPSNQIDVSTAPALLTPHLVCAAAVYALVQADGEHDPAELDWVVAHCGNLDAFRCGGAWMMKHDFGALLSEADRLLGLAQKECLLFNLLELGFADNRLGRAERAMLEEWRQALGMSEERYAQAYEVQLAQASIGTLVNETPAGPDWQPLNLLCACLIAVIRYSPESSNRRRKHLERRIESQEALNNGQTYLDQLEIDGILSMLPHLLNPAQCRCLVLNVLSEAYFSGDPGPAVESLIRDLREASGSAPAVFDRDVDIFRNLSDRKLFRESAATR